MAAQAFTSLALVSLLTTPVIVFIQVLPMVIQSIASFDRIQEFCNYSGDSEICERELTATKTNKESYKSTITLMSLKPDQSSQLDRKIAISLQGASFGWTKGKPAVLHNITLDIQQGCLTVVVGPTGSGKSAFLHAILGEMVSIWTKSEMIPRTENMSYCSQEPWLENRSIRQNIIGVSSYDPDWYVTVKFVSGIEADLKQLRNGDRTRVGSKGLNLSGGQKQRIVSKSPKYRS